MKFKLLYITYYVVLICLISFIEGCDFAPTQEEIGTVIESTIESYNLDGCSKEEERVLDSIRNHNFAYVKQYLENGGEPNLCCNMDSHSRSLIPDYVCLHMHLTDSVEFIKYYLTFNVADYVLNDLLEYYVLDLDEEMVEMLIKEGGHFPVDHSGYDDWQRYYALLDKFDYDFNWQDPEYDGFTLLMMRVGCPCYKQEDVDNAIKEMQYLIKLGARTDVKDFDGNTLLDVAVNKQIIRFIKELEE